MDYAGTNYPALTDTDTLYDVKAYSEALRAAMITAPNLGSTGRNLNSIVTSGNYYQNSGANATAALNYPTTSAGMLEVISAGASCYQRYWRLYDSGAIYIRTSTNGTWTAWKTISAT